MSVGVNVNSLEGIRIGGQTHTRAHTYVYDNVNASVTAFVACFCLLVLRTFAWVSACTCKDSLIRSWWAEERAQSVDTEGPHGVTRTCEWCVGLDHKLATSLHKSNISALATCMKKRRATHKDTKKWKRGETN